MQQNFISWYLESSFWQVRISSSQQCDGVAIELLWDCSNSFVISDEISANVWKLARNTTDFYFVFMRLVEESILRGKQHQHRYSAP